MDSSNLYGPEHAAVYAQIPSHQPPKLIEDILSYLNAKDFGSANLTVDVGCGSGQNTYHFVPHFKNVLGVDASKPQIQEATKKNMETNVSFKVGFAEDLPVPDQSVQLITACSTCHFFDMLLFYEEAKRVLVPNGVLALYSDGLPSLRWKNKSEELTAPLHKIILEDTWDFWVKQFQFALDKYEDEVFDIPFADIYRRNDYDYDEIWTVAEVAELLKSFSGFQSYKDKMGPESAEELIERFVEQSLETMGETNPDEARLTVRFSYFLVMGRKTSN